MARVALGALLAAALPRSTNSGRHVFRYRLLDDAAPRPGPRPGSYVFGLGCLSPACTGSPRPLCRHRPNSGGPAVAILGLPAVFTFVALNVALASSAETSGLAIFSFAVRGRSPMAARHVFTGLPWNSSAMWARFPVPWRCYAPRDRRLRTLWPSRRLLPALHGAALFPVGRGGRVAALARALILIRPPPAERFTLRPHRRLAAPGAPSIRRPQMGPGGGQLPA